MSWKICPTVVSSSKKIGLGILCHNNLTIVNTSHAVFGLFLQVLPFPSQVVYNRVGKCGSRTVVILLRLLAEKHQFNLVSSDIHNKTRLTKHEQVRRSDHRTMDADRLEQGLKKVRQVSFD